jgi:DNA-binding MarR family transcriptional regulator
VPEPYSQEILAVLAFITDHSGCNVHQIVASLRMETTTVMDALIELTESELIIRHSHPSDLRENETAEHTSYHVKRRYFVEHR